MFLSKVQNISNLHFLEVNFQWFSTPKFDFRQTEKPFTSHTDLSHNSANYVHILVESLKLSMTDTMHFSTDPDKVNVPVEGLLSKDYALQRAQLIQMDK